MKLRFAPQFVPSFFRAIWPATRAGSGIVIALLGGLALSGDPLESIRVASTLLQILGAGVVGVGLVRLRKHFGLPPLLGYPREWVRLFKLVFWRPDPIVARGVAVGGSIAIGGSARVTVGLQDGAPLHARITKLEEQTKQLSADLHKVESKLRQQITAESEQLRQKVAEVRQTTDQINRTLKDLSVGGIDLEIIGFLWLLLGTILSGLPEAWVLGVWQVLP